MDRAISELFDYEGSLQRVGLIVERVCGGRVQANVAPLGVHSRDFEVGYVGSAPAHLALCVLNAVYPPGAARAEVASHQLAGGRVSEAVHGEALCATVSLGFESVEVSALAFRLHHLFEADFIARLPEDGGTIAIDVIRAWVHEHAGDAQP